MKLKRDKYRAKSVEEIVVSLADDTLTSKNYWLSNSIYDKIQELDSKQWSSTEDYADLLDMLAEMLQINNINPNNLIKIRIGKTNEEGNYTKLLYTKPS